MDTNIRLLLTSASKVQDERGLASLREAYNLLQNVAENQMTADAPEAFGQDLYVLCAEIAFQYGLTELARESLKMYFMKTPPANQFLCRAYLCQAQLLAPTSAENPEQLEKGVVYLLKAIKMAKENPRYHFLVYNASLLYWQFCRPFLKPFYRQYLASSLHQVVKALDDIDDKDYEWRAQLMIALIECHIDAGKRGDAANVAGPAASFIRHHVPSLYKTVFGLLVKHQLVESSKFSKELKVSTELSVYYKICKVKLAIEQNDPDVDPQQEMYHILQLMGAPEDPRAAPILREKSDAKSETSRSRKSGASSAVSEDRKSPVRMPRRTPTPSSTKKLSSDSKEKKKLPKDDPSLAKPFLLLELGRLALDQDLPDIAQQAADMIKDCTVSDQGFFLEVEFLQSELMVKALRDRQESYSKKIVELRLQAVKRCDEALQNAVRHGNPNIIQAGCVAQWNLCLPLLQPNLRLNVRRPLTAVAEALESIQSLLIQLRCQVHMELAKCEEDQEQIVVAMEHLKKALGLDDHDVYREQLQVALQRLELRANLYQQPERPEDQAAMIIEQARKADSGTIRMKRSLLMKAGQALAPDAFLLVLDSESDTKEVATGKGLLTEIKKLVGKARQWNKGIKKAPGHLKRLGDENDKERAHLWGDLAKTARKQEVWDVCRTATRFCLLYDDNRWRAESPSKDGTISPKTRRSKTETSSSSVLEERQDSDLSKSQTSKQESKDDGNEAMAPNKGVALYERSLVRLMSEVHFINVEATIHLLRSERVELLDNPIPPQDTSKRPKGYVATQPEDDPEWQEYCEWIKCLSTSVLDSLTRAVDLGRELREPWIICNAGVYLWNYSNHLLSQNRHRELIDVLQYILDGIKAIGHAGETTVLVNVCNGLALGLIQPWVPPPVPRDVIVPSPVTNRDEAKSPAQPASPKKSKAAPAAPKSKPSISAVSINLDAQPDLKRAVEVCEYAMGVTNGVEPLDMVPIATRQQLLQTWVRAKQMLQSQISKGLGTESENNNEGQRPMTRAIVAIEMLSLQSNGIMEFKEVPALQGAVELIESCTWTDKLVELQLWTRLAYLAYEAKSHNHVVHCTGQALRFATEGTQAKGKKHDRHKQIVEQEMLAYSSCLLGQSLVENTQGKNSVRRQAMEQFLNSARFAKTAGNGEMVMTAARHYWNTCLPLVNQPMERELLKEPLLLLLDAVNATTDKAAFINKEEQEEEPEVPPAGIPPAQPQGTTEGKPVADQLEAPPKSGIIGGPDDDLTLRASLYGVLFQCYADKGEWEDGLKAMDQAISDMPRTNHRLLIFRHLVMVKARLGKDVSMSIQKFKDESEDYVAHMWRRVALCSKEQLEQLQAYQNAIAALSTPATDWLKYDYLLELGQWLFCNEFPLQDALDQILWAVDILLNMKFEVEQKKDAHDDEKKGKGKGKKGKKKSSAKAPKKPEKKAEVARKSPEALSDTESEMFPGDVIPVKKEVIIGLAPSYPDLSIAELIDISQLEGLFRSHTILARMVGRNSVDHAGYCLMAYSYIMQLWKVSMSHCGPVIKELAKNPPPEPQGKKSAKGKKEKEARALSSAGTPHPQEKPKEKPKRKGPLDALPHSTEEWAVYDAPDEVLEAFRQDVMKMNGINQHTINKPMLTVHYLDILVKQLMELGYTHLTLPILALADVIARDIVKSSALLGLVHLRAMEVCVQLNLTSGINFHKKLAAFKINEEDQAKCQEEMALLRERQIQVAKEERRIKDSMDHLKKKSAKPKRQLTELEMELQEKMKDGPTVTHLGQQLGVVQLQEVWTDTAEILLRQGMYQPARDLLNQAHQAAIAFEDKALTSRVLYLLGQLSYLEAQYGQCYNFCNQAQHIYDGDEMHWYKTTALMVDAAMSDYTKKDRLRRARNILVDALNVFAQVAETRPNKVDITGYILAQLEAKLGHIQAQIAFQEPDILKTKVMNAIDSACKKLQHGAEQLIRLGYKREAIPKLREHAAILQKLARINTDLDEKHICYYKAIQILQEAIAVSEDVHYDVHTLAALQELRNVSTPVQREAAGIKLDCCDLMLEVFQLHVQEQRQRQQAELRKGSVLKMVEDFTCETPDYAQTERNWINMTNDIAETVLYHVTSAHSLSGSIHQLKAKCLYMLGRCLRLLSHQNLPDAPQHWDVKDLTVLNLADQIEQDKEKIDPEDGEKKEEEEIDVRQNEKYKELICRMKDQLEGSDLQLVQAVECLMQAVNMGLQKGHTSVVGAAALELVECIGQFDPSLSSHFLALHQSCAASEYMEGLLLKALYDPTLSQAASLAHQRKLLLADDLTANASRSPVFSSITKTLKESQAHKRLAISPNHLDLVKEFPPNFNLVVLQHSPDRSHLYGAIIDKPNKASGGGKGQKHATIQTSSKAKVVRIQTSPQRLDGLLDKFKRHKHEVMTFLLKLEYQRSQQAQRNKMLANLGDQLRPGTRTSLKLSMDKPGRDPQAEAAEREEQRLHEEFLSLLQEMEQYLQPITVQLDALLRPPSSTTVSNSEKHKDKEPPPAQEYVVLLADPYLLELPLEALHVLQGECVVSLSRDISLQMLYHKSHVEVLDEAAEKARKEREKNAPPSRIPGLRDAAKKMSKIIPLERPIPAGCLPVDTHAFRYFVDPLLDCSETEQHRPVEVFNKVLTEHEQQFTPRWLGVMGNEHAPSPGEYEIYASESSAVLFYGMERFSCYLPPHKVAALNIPDCQMVMLFDLAQTSKSFLRQSKTDVHKTAAMLCLEKPVQYTLLLGLTGTRCIMANQWHCTLKENAEKMEIFMRELLAKGKTSGQTLMMLFCPQRRKAEEAAAAAAAEAAESKDKGAKRDSVSDQKDAGEDGSQAGEEQEEAGEEMVMTREWFNMVCYGLPNIMVTQLGKV